MKTSLISLFFSLSFYATVIMSLHLFSPGYAAVAILGNETDKLSLLEFKSHVTEDPFGVLASWNASLHFCQWTGVTCGLKHQRVTILDLKKHSFAGTISPNLGKLSFLQLLDLADNSFHGGIPPELGSLIRIRNMNLSYNLLRGNIPMNLSRCSNLRNLVLEHNNLVYHIPPELGSLSKLEKLYLRNNNLTGGFPSSIGNLTSLQELYLSFNNLKGEVPDTVDQLRSLRQLGLSVNNLSGKFPPALYNLSSLELISLSFNNFTGNLKENIGLVFPNLQKLYLATNSFAGSIPVSLSNTTYLLQLDLPQNNFTGNIPTNFGNLEHIFWLNFNANHLGNSAPDDLSFLNSLANCSNLQFLGFGDNNFGGMLPNSFTNLSTHMTRLTMYRNRIRGSIPEGISNLVNLNVLFMSENLFEGYIPASIGKLSNMGSLDLNSNKLAGNIPSAIGNITQLMYLYLEDNRLEGSIPSSLGNCDQLLTVDLSQNRLSGTIPKQLMGISSLTIILNVSHNSLTGPLPEEFGNLTNLVELDFSYNKFYGEIPSTLGNCLSLNVLLMQKNLFQGSLPDLSNLKSLQYADFSSNNLSGLIPPYMAKLSYLLYLNLSFNNLMGGVPLQGVFANVSRIEVLGNTKLCNGIPELHLRPCVVNEPERHKKCISLKLILVIAIVASCGFLSLRLLLLHWMKAGKSKPHSSSASGHLYTRISYLELFNATGGFFLGNLIGRGSFGTVYKGTLGLKEETVAIKVLNLRQHGASKSFIAECQALRNIRHRNLVKVITACSSTDFEGNEFKALVYQFMPNGSLDEWLHSGHSGWTSLNILQRINIAIDVASALCYLHYEGHTPVVHCDLKPSNVLLDSDLNAHVGDFGLARFLSNFSKEPNLNQVSSLGIKGTIGYAPPEYGMGCQVSTLGDVYSYGILLLEIFTGRRPTDELFKDNFNIHNFVKMALLDQVLEIIDRADPCKEEIGGTTKKAEHFLGDLGSQEIGSLISVLKIGVACSAESPRERMSMRQVSRELTFVRDKFLESGTNSMSR